MGILDQFRLDGKTALVTGCSRGMGRAIAIALAEAGADVVGVSEHMSTMGSDVAERVTALGRSYRGYTCDLGDRESLYEFVRTAKADNPAIDILVNNAGTIARKPAAEHPDEMWDRVINVNLHAPFLLTREFGKEMVARGSGKIVFTASLLTYQGGITVPGYAASKGGVGRLVMAFANEWAGKGVNVNGIAPGYIRTDVTEALQKDPVRNPAILARIPAGRWGDPEDMQGAVVFLASRAADNIHGEIITVDGGWMGR
jgi:2-deoxy-D-gluconate 3-dehydrogenase